MSQDKRPAKRKKIPTLPLAQCLAKTWKKDKSLLAGRSVEEHCRIAGAIAKRLLEGYLRIISPLFPANAPLLALVHDVGKVSPTFQKKIWDALKISIPELKDINPEIEKRWGHHWAISYASVYDRADDEKAARVAGYHHGLNFGVNDSECFDYGGKEWESMRQKLLDTLLDNSLLPEIKTHMQEILVLGLVVLADWIASGSIFDDPHTDWHLKIDEAIEKAGLIMPSFCRDMTFPDIFPFGPNEIQRECMQRITEPGVYVIEAPMGMGKTEAALAAAYNLLASGKASGIYFGLPTQLTSNKIYERVNDFLEKILLDKSSLVLAHGNARLKKYLDQELGKEGAPGGSWFDGNRRGLLAPFAVGTLDQALLSVLHVRHAGLRALGLAGKVVILDEVHSYDAYTGELLDELVSRLRRCGCTVIILSATLTAERRNKMLDLNENPASAYPLLTFVAADSKPEAISPGAPAAKNVNMHFENDDRAAIEEALRRAEMGQQVLWIENTVAKAQLFYKLIGARAEPIGVECGLLHSRYTPNDRESNENRWTAIFGKSSPERSKRGRILVGTQVLEQSLDLDADFLVTRICPTDMLLQRMGRLWRHERNDRAASAACETWILTPPPGEVLADPENALKESGTSYVYSPYILGRTLETWHERDHLELPGDIRALLENTYQERKTEPSPKMTEEKRKLVEMCNKNRLQALAGESTAGQMLPDDAPGTRLGSREELKLLLLRDLDLKNGVCICADGMRVAFNSSMSHAERAAAASRLALNTVRIPYKCAPQKIKADDIKAFEPFIYEARTWCDKDGKLAGGNLRIALLDDGQILRDIHGNQLPGLRYSQEIGYSVEG